MGVAAVVIVFLPRQGTSLSVGAPLGERSEILSSLEYCSVGLYFGSYLLLSALARPEDHVCLGLHQPVGPCNELEVDMFGRSLAKYGVTELRTWTRGLWLCAQNYTEPFQLASPGGPTEPYQEWYTVRGVARSYAE